MKKLFVVIFFSLLPSLVFSQGVGKTNLGFMAGLSIPTAPKDFRSTHSSGFNFNINVDHTISKAIVLGGELDFARQTGSLTEYYGGAAHTKDNPYQLKYAESVDGIHYVRKDNDLNLNLSKVGFDTEMMSYPYVILINGKKYMFYNGNQFGKEGIGLAIEE